MLPHDLCLTNWDGLDRERGEQVLCSPLRGKLHFADSPRRRPA